MKKLLCVYIIFASIISVQGCGVSSRSIMHNEASWLRAYNNIYIRTVSQSGETDEAYKFALEREKLAIALERLGFNVVSLGDDPDAFVDFYVHTIRYDDKTGWVADWMSAAFVSTRDRSLLAKVEARSRLIPASVDSMIEEIVDEVRKVY